MTIDEIIKQRAEGGYVFGEKLEKAIMKRYAPESRPKIESILDIVRQEKRTWEMQCEQVMPDVRDVNLCGGIALAVGIFMIITKWLALW